MVSMYQPKNLHNSDVWPRKFWGSKLTASRCLQCHQLHGWEIHDTGPARWCCVQPLRIRSHAMPCLDGMTGLDWAVHGQEPAYFVVVSGISDGFEDIIVHPTNTYWPPSQKIKQDLRAVNYFFRDCYNINMAKPIINTVSFQGYDDAKWLVQ